MAISQPALLKLVQVNQVRRELSNIKSPHYDIQDDSEFNYAFPEMRVKIHLSQQIKAIVLTLTPEIYGNSDSVTMIFVKWQWVTYSMSQSYCQVIVERKSIKKNGMISLCLCFFHQNDQFFFFFYMYNLIPALKNASSPKQGIAVPA